MAKMFRGFIILMLAIAYLSAGILMINQNQSVPPKSYKLVWNDEFNGNSLDMTKWSHHWLGKRKLGYTTEDSIKVDNGTLKIIIHKEGDKYCSGMIDTHNKFETEYGYFEIRAKLPKIKGPQSAFWLLSQNYGKDIGRPDISGMEIDIMEYVKTTPGQVHFTTHWDGYSFNHKKNEFTLKYPSIEDGLWHTFGLLWTPDRYDFYVDGKLMHTKSNPISHTNEYVLLSAEVGPWGGGNDMSNERLPDQFEVDYVRVYQKQ
jgi:beta-glucanase (GH16 family)